MARRGVFGRIPRAAPDLTNTIVALVREAMSQEDSNMVDAWKNGGKVEGKGVDDDRLLAHMKMRRDNLDKDDPSWDEWNNNYIQYDFAINESKMALKNDQGKLSDAGMAAFYKKWAGRSDVQQDSEFYRHLLSQAAKWNSAANQRNAGNAAKAAAEAHVKWRDGYYKSHVQGAETANGYLLLIARTYHAAPNNATSLDDINPDSDGYGKFLDVINDGKVDDPYIQGLINEMNVEIGKVNPNWKYSASNLSDLLDRGDKGLERLIRESTTKEETNDWTGRRETLRYEKTRIKQTAANNRVQVAADTFAIELDNCSGDPYCARTATKKLHDKLVKEAGSIVAGQGGVDPLTGRLQDTKTASALITTIDQLEDSLSGKTVEAPAAALAVTKGEGPAKGYTIFDAAAGADSPTGWLGRTGNAINDDSGKLDRGGWIMTEPNEQQGVPILDGQGRPTYRATIYDANTPKPASAVAVPGTQQMEDTTRITVGPGGTNVVTTHPVTYIVPSPPNVVLTDAAGRTVDPKTGGSVRLFNGTVEAPPPWVELRGVKGPDGVARTLYRTGDGTTANPYLFHENPPVVNGTKPNAAGQFSIPVTMQTDEKGNSYLKGDIATYVTGVGAARATVASGNYVLGTYGSAGAARTSAAIADAWNSGDNKAGSKADQYLVQYQRGIEALPMNDPDRIAGIRDLGQLAQTVNLYKSIGNGKTLQAAYDEANRLPAASQAYVDQLAAAGFTSQRYGQAEVDRRVSLLEGIDAADARIAARPPIRQDVYAPLGGSAMTGTFMQGGPRPDMSPAERALLAQQRKDVLNPTISVSSIKVPGMPGIFAPGASPGQAVNPYAPEWMGRLGQVPGVGMPATPQPLRAPAQAPGMPAFTGAPMAPTTPKTPPPKPPAPPPPPPANPTPTPLPQPTTPPLSTVRRDRWGNPITMTESGKTYYT